MTIDLKEIGIRNWQKRISYVPQDPLISDLSLRENIAFGFNGVQKAYAIQAGRELRVMVESDRVSDNKAEELSFKISEKIQTEMTYPGQVRITVIREKRSVHYAK